MLTVPPILRRDDLGALAYALSDAEAGTPRQWYWLEIAATLSAAAAPRRVVSAVGRLGPLWCWPWLARGGLPGIALYAGTLAPVWRQACDKATAAALYVAAIPALLAGLGLWPATQAFAAWLLLMVGALHAAWRAPVAEAFEDSDASPGPEECTGLTGLLLAAGCEPARALALVAALRASPDTGWPALVDAFPALRPPPPSRRTLAGLHAVAWLAGALPATTVLSLLPASWGLGAAALTSAGWIARLAGRKAALVTAGSTALLYGLGAAVHLL